MCVLYTYIYVCYTHRTWSKLKIYFKRNENSHNFFPSNTIPDHFNKGKHLYACLSLNIIVSLLESYLSHMQSLPCQSSSEYKCNHCTVPLQNLLWSPINCKAKPPNLTLIALPSLDPTCVSTSVSYHSPCCCSGLQSHWMSRSPTSSCDFSEIVERGFG